MPAARRDEIQDNSSSQQSEEDAQMVLKYGAEHALQIIKPVTICLIVVVATISTISFYTRRGQYL